MTPPRHTVAVAVCLAAAILLLSGCAFDGSQKASGKQTVAVTERDFKISAPSRLPSGNVNFAVTNRGPSAHELIVVRSRSGQLPLRSDGLTVNEEKLEPEEVGGLEPGDPGVRQLSFHLAPGNYELFCNMAGHYRGGMHRKLVVY
jgi:hypothetical protein